MKYFLGIDTGSTTVKTILIDENKNIIFKKYERHFSQVRESLYSILLELKNKNIINGEIAIGLTGSAGIQLATDLDINFVQEVIAGAEAVKYFIPETDVAIELGGEDAKITFFEKVMDQKMNGSCAGGTGAFIDQMASLLETDPTGLNELAKNYKMTYPIASRCGVFAKTDIQPLINEGAQKEDIAASIFQAVVNQTIAGLAQGKRITGKVAFLGGPLFFLSELRNAFATTLNLKEEDVLIPEDSHYFVAIGVCINLMKNDSKAIDFDKFINSFNTLMNKKVEQNGDSSVKPLFESEKEYSEFKERHNKANVEYADISTYKGSAYLGIDAGSTTTKIVLLSTDNKILYSFYGNNKGNPLNLVEEQLKHIYSIMNDDIIIRQAAATGYGENLIKNAFSFDIGEVETICHLKSAQFFNPKVDFVIDIGGQDMKSFKIKDGIIDSIMLNEACSSGCGSFIETYAQSLNMNVADFSTKGIYGNNPVDLGTRCTVFMNSRIKQVQKEGVSVENLSAGLSVSVVKNALFKVIRIKNTDDLGKNIVVQGGTFLNDSVLRAFEQTLERNVTRPIISGLMGAFGASLLAKEIALHSTQDTTMITKEELNNFGYKSQMTKCKLCTNNCTLTINTFSTDNEGKSKRRFISGNRCEKPLGAIENNKVDIPNLFDYKYTRTFDYYKPLSKTEAVRGEIGIPRALNMYENYPLWFTFFTELGFRVVMSDDSSKDIYLKGMESISSDTICYPAKMANGHIHNLMNKNVANIFYPCIPYNIKEDDSAANHYNCPIVNSYPEVIEANIDELKEKNYFYEYLPIYDEKQLVKRLHNIFGEKFSISKNEISKAIKKGYKALDEFKEDVRKEGEKAFEFAQKNNLKTIVLAGRVYHADPEIHHGIPDLLKSLNFVVLTEDAIAHLGNIKRPLQVVDQWTYHSRLYKAAEFVTRNDNIELIQLNSFSCGLDAITTDEVKRILEDSNKIYTLLKIDEISNLGAVRIRLRSLIASMQEKDRNKLNIKIEKPEEKETYSYPIFTKEMKETHTILVPQMAPIQFQFLEKAFQMGGFKTELLVDVEKNAVDEGLKNIHNDACYPSIIVVGQFIAALKSGKYDLDKIALIISQTGGGCRATNYVSFLRKALENNGMGHIPVITFNVSGSKTASGFQITPSMIKDVIHGALYGDLLMRLVHKTRPYEINKGETSVLYQAWMDKLKNSMEKTKSKREFNKNVKEIIKEFSAIEVNNEERIKVGIVGEILVKFHPLANNYLVDYLENEGIEVNIPELYDFFLYTLQAGKEEYKYYKKNLKRNVISTVVLKYLESYRQIVINELGKTRYKAPKKINDMKKLTDGYVSTLNNMGEGWLLTAEMLHLLEDGVNNIVCVQPFGCLPNHVSGKGMIKKLRDKNPYSNIVSIDYDPGASEVNQINRIKLMIENSKRQFN